MLAVSCHTTVVVYNGTKGVPKRGAIEYVEGYGITNPKRDSPTLILIFQSKNQPYLFTTCIKETSGRQVIKN